MTRSGHARVWWSRPSPPACCSSRSHRSGSRGARPIPTARRSRTSSIRPRRAAQDELCNMHPHWRWPRRTRSSGSARATGRASTSRSLPRTTPRCARGSRRRTGSRAATSSASSRSAGRPPRWWRSRSPWRSHAGAIAIAGSAARRCSPCSWSARSTPCSSSRRTCSSWRGSSARRCRRRSKGDAGRLSRSRGRPRRGRCSRPSGSRRSCSSRALPAYPISNARPISIAGTSRCA